MAVQHYETIAGLLERDASPLAGRPRLFYPQGSMAIGAAIASGVTNDDFDLDMVLQLRCGNLTPQEVLDLLFRTGGIATGAEQVVDERRRHRITAGAWADAAGGDGGGRGYGKVRCRGLHRNRQRIALLLGFGNLPIAERRLAA